MIKRKLEELCSSIYRALIFPFVKISIELKTKSIIKQNVYLNKGTKLLGKNHLDRNVYLSNVEIGFGSYFGRNSVASNLKVGKYVSIGQDFRTIFGTHPTNRLSTHPGFYSKDCIFPAKYAKETVFKEQSYTDESNGYQAEIGNDVWIGASVSILQGVKIGDGAVIGACSLVTKDVEPYAIYAGSPAKKIRMRFDDDTVKKLLDEKWWNNDEKWISENIDKFKNPL